MRKSKKVLGMNARNLSFIRPSNSKKAVRLVDDKLRSKEVLRKNGLPTVELLGVVRNRKEFYKFPWHKLENSFVLKPNRGLGGGGILVTYGRKKNGRWVLPNNKEAELKDVILRVSNILDGDFSKTNIPDSAFFEERLKIHPAFKLYCYKGVPDIRVIVYNKVPIMAMLRLPTKNSDGRANLHKGGIGVGIDIESGITTHAIQYDREIEYLPEMKLPLRGLQIPEWNNILELAVKSVDACGLNYAGVDLAVDKEKGPVIMELNAHPGLSIQIANMAPLKDRLKRVKGLKIRTAQKGISVAKELFGGDLAQEVKELTGKKIIGIIHQIGVKKKSEKKFTTVEAKVDTGAGITAIDEELARQLGFAEAIEYYHSFNIKRVLTKEEVDELSEKQVWKEIVKHKDIVEVVKIFSSHGISYRIEVPLVIKLAGHEIHCHASVIERENLKYPVILGRRDLNKFLIDPGK